jgi:energy-coupling factor transport system permease protein
MALALPMPRYAVPALLAVLGGALVPLLTSGAGQLVRLLRRTRWLLLSLFLVYALATPGEPLAPYLGDFSPSREGVEAGLVQALRLFAVLATLARLLAATPRSDLLKGLYFLLRPLCRLGVDAGRIASRLWLTLHYAEDAPSVGREGWRAWLRAELATLGEERRGAGEDVVELEIPPFSKFDFMALAAAAAVALGLLQL